GRARRESGGRPNSAVPPRPVEVWCGAGDSSLWVQVMADKPVKKIGAVSKPRRKSAQATSTTEIHTKGGPSFGKVDARRDFVGRDRIVGDTYIFNNVDSAKYAARLIRNLGRGANLEQTATKYLEFLLDRHRYLSLKGLGVSDRVPLKLPLLDLYVPLKARRQMPEGDTWQRHLSLAGRTLAEGEQREIAGKLGEPEAVLTLLQSNDGLIVLGDPGSGKTTFLKFLALMVAAGKGSSLGLGDRLPILVPLSGYANVLEGSDVRLDDFIVSHFHDVGGNLPLSKLLDESLANGRALLLLDGLDEVKNIDQRHTVVEKVQSFYSLYRRNGNKFVITSRIVGYREVRPTAEGLEECTLVDFDDEDIQSFVTRWTLALEAQAEGETAHGREAAANERAILLQAIQGSAGARHLAANPLLLTILALMKRQGVDLPERRVQLYENYVKTLLSSWNRARSLSGRTAGRSLDVEQTLKVLAPLALWMHETSPVWG
ncbi:MAG: NACHT domain-containing protein, partial [Burkholderiales bacterium]